ncbi:hypothetical protein Tco_1204356 [Tanacetum coccineum]
MKQGFMGSGGKWGGRKLDKSKDNKAFCLNDSLTATKDVEDEAMGSSPSLSEAIGNISHTRRSDNTAHM